MPMRWHFPKYKILSFEETIREIIHHKKSFSRFGDGEFRLLIAERDIVFQKLSLNLREKLIEVMHSELPNLIIGIPSTLNTRKNLKKPSTVHWLNFININGKKISRHLDENKFYGDSLISRFYMIYEDKRHVPLVINTLQKIWEKKDILIIEGIYSRLGIGNDLFDNAKEIKRIICPAENAFENYDKILHAAKFYGRDKLIIIALGPTASILAYDLAKHNYWAVDLGHVDVEYMWFVGKAKKKEPLAGKKAAEANQRHVADLTGQEKINYEDSILEYCL